MPKILSPAALALFVASTSFAQEPIRKLVGNNMNDWPEIERVKLWKPVLSCDEGAVTIDTAVTRENPKHCTGPNDEIYYKPFNNCLYHEDIIRNDVQLVIRNKDAARYLDSFIYRNPSTPSFHYEHTWDLQRNHLPVKDVNDADELIIRGKSRWRIWDSSSAGEFIVSAPLPYYLYAQEQDMILASPGATPSIGHKSLVTIQRKGDAVRVSLKHTYPLTEAANWEFRGCRTVN